MKIRINLNSPNQNLWFTSDLHLFHNKILIYDNRPFETIEEMHSVIVERWNSVVKPNDIVFFLGDLAFVKSNQHEDLKKLLNLLNGEIHFVMGNHDEYKFIKSLNRFASINDLAEISVNYKDDNDKHAKIQFVCMHYPIYSWNKSHHGVMHLHGHTHGNLHHGEDASYYVNRRSYDVGCMLHDFYPVNFLAVKGVLEKIKIIKTNRES